MQLDQLVIEAKPRTAWQAFDLGIRLASRWWMPLFILWVVPAGVFSLLATLVFWQQPLIAGLVVWWFKPLWDRLPLLWASESLFGATPALDSVFKRISQAYKYQWFKWISYGRFTPTRSHDMPVVLLEKLSGKAYAKRVHVLHAGTSSSASWATLLGIHIEGFLFYGLLVLAYLLIPENVDIQYSQLLDPGGVPMWLERLSVLAATLIAASVAPFYVMVGFILYINRRISLEAWDCEIQFRNMRASGSQFTASLVLAFSLVAAGFFADSTLAQDGLVDAAAAESIESWSADQAHQKIDEIVHAPPFVNVEHQSGWRLKSQAENNEGTEREFWGFLDGFFDSLSWLSDVFLALSWIVKIVLLGLAGVAVFFILKAISRFRGVQLDRVSQLEEGTSTPPKTLFDLDLNAERYPENLADAARDLWQNKQRAEAIRMLYGGSLSRLVHERRIAFRDGHTERECAQLVEQQGNLDLSTFMWELTRLWQSFAYASSLPNDHRFLTVCDHWVHAFAQNDPQESTDV